MWVLSRLKFELDLSPLVLLPALQLPVQRRPHGVLLLVPPQTLALVRAPLAFLLHAAGESRHGVACDTMSQTPTGPTLGQGQSKRISSYGRVAAA